MARILLIDDEEVVRKCLARLIALEFMVEEATDGKDGLRKYKKFNPDIVLLDYFMPGWNGLITARELLKYDQFANIILLTGHVEVNEVLNEYNDIIDTPSLNFRAFINKPVEPDLLMTSIRNVLAEFEPEKKKRKRGGLGRLFGG